MITFHANKMHSLPAKVVFASIACVVFLSATAFIIYQSNVTKHSLQVELNTQFLKMDSLMAVKLIADKTVDETRASLIQVQSINQKLSNDLKASSEAVVLKQRKINTLEEQQKKAQTKNKRDILSRKQSSEKRAQEKILLQNIEDLKQENLLLKEKIKFLESEKASIPNVIEKKSVLQVHPITVQPQRRKKNGKVRLTAKAKKVDQLSVNFKVAENVQDKPKNKSLYIVITNPQKEILSLNHPSKASSDNAPGVFTGHQLIQFNNLSQNVVWYWLQDAKYSKGTYTLEIYSDGKSLGQHQFGLK